MNKPLILSGSGGGGGGGSSPTILPDTLLSKDLVEFTLGVCEGPIAGLIDGPQSFFLDDTPLVSSVGDNNFNPFELHVYHGDEFPSEVKNILGGTVSNTQVGVRLAQNTSVVRTTPSTLRNQIDRLEVRILFNTLLKSTTSGDQLEENALFQIKYRQAGETVWNNFFNTMSNTKLTLSSTVKTTVNADRMVYKTVTTETEISEKGNLVSQGPSGASAYQVGGSVADVSLPGYTRSKTGSYGKLYINDTNGDYEYVVTPDVAETLSQAEIDTFTLTASMGQDKEYRGILDVRVRNPNILEITGKTTSGYAKDFTKGVPRVDNDWEIQVTKLSPDNEEYTTVAMTWESFQMVTKGYRSYDNLAVVRGLGQASDQFSGIPTFAGAYGCKIIRVPSNYDPKTRYYDGAWDGTWKMAMTDNPAWCLYDLLTNELYGLKRYYPHLKVDRYSFYDAAKWCDGLVPRPGGGYQPRFTYSDKIDQPRNALELVYFLAGIFGAVPVSDLNGTVSLKIDKPGLPSQIFGPESVTADGFQYSFSDVTQRPNDFLVKFINPNLDFAEDVRQVFDQTLIDANGRNPEDMVALGCNDVYEAQRRAFRRLLQANTETTTVTFQTARMGLGLQIFDLIGVVDPHMNWGISGRVKSRTLQGQDVIDCAVVTHNGPGDDNSAPTVVNNEFLQVTTGATPTYATQGTTTGTHYLIQNEQPRYDGKNIRVWARMRASSGNPTGQAHLAYSTSDNGNSGLHSFAVTDEWQWFQFEYQLPVLNNNNGDYIGIWADAGKSVDVQEIQVETVDGTVINLRDPLYLPTNVDLDFQLQTPSGIHTVVVQSAQPATTELTVQSGIWPADAPEFAQFAIESATVGLVKPFRILNIQEDSSTPELLTVTALEQNVNKYSDVDNMVSSGTVQYESAGAAFPDAPVITNVHSGTDHLYKNKDGKIVSRIFVEWDHNPGTFADDFIVFYRRKGIDSRYKRLRTTGRDAYIDQVQDGAVYQIYVVAENPLGRRSKNPIKVRHQVVGKTAPPSDVLNLTASQSGPDVQLDFDAVDDVDLSHYKVKIGQVGDTWETAKFIGSTPTNSFIDRNIKFSPAVYFVKAVDTSKNHSENAVEYTFNVETPGTPAATISFENSTFVLNVIPDANDDVPVSEYIVRHNNNEVFRGKSSRFSGPADWLGARTYEVSVLNVAGQESVRHSVIGTVVAPAAPTLTSLIAETSYYLQWNVPTATLPISHYVVKDVTDNKILEANSPGTIYTGTVDWLGNHDFEVYAVDTAGNTGAVASTYVNVAAPTVTGLLSSVSRSTLKLTWTGNVESLPIRKFRVYEGASFATATELGRVNAETFSLPVDWNGSQTFYVVAVDTAGNVGPEASVIETIDPPAQPAVLANIVDQNVHLSWSGAETELLLQRMKLENRIEWQQDVWDPSHGEARADISAVDSNVDHLVISTISNPSLTTSGKTTGFKIPIPAEMTKQWYSDTITVRVKAASSGTSPGSQLITTYSTNAVGNANVNTFTIDATPTWYEFQYSIASPNHNGAIENYIGIWGEAGKDVGVWEVELWTSKKHFADASGSSTTFAAQFLGTTRYFATPEDQAGNTGPAGEATVTVSPPEAFTLTGGIKDNLADFSWDEPVATLPIAHYDIRRGSTFSGSSQVAKISSNAHSFPADWLGTETFWAQAVDTAGNVSPEQSVEIDIVAPSAPAPRSEVIDNNVLLRWSNGSGTLPVVATEIRKGSDFASAEVLQQMDATFATFFEFTAGTYTYWLVNIDSAGNYGTAAAITTVVSEPPDFVLQTAYTSDFSGTKTRVIDGPNGLLFGIDPTETVADHFQNNGFDTPQQQIDGGYPIFIQPVDHLTPASYQEEYDLGGVLKSSIITITPTTKILGGDGTIEVDIEFRELATDPWIKHTNINRVYAQNFQFVRFTLRLVADSKHDLMEVSRIDMRLNVKIRNDAGSGVAAAADTNGTSVNFNVDFVDVASITVTPNTTTPVIPVYDFEDIQNPTGFTVYLFDKNGVRVNGDFSWAVRGY